MIIVLIVRLKTERENFCQLFGAMFRGYNPPEWEALKQYENQFDGASWGRANKNSLPTSKRNRHAEGQWRGVEEEVWSTVVISW